MTMEKTVEIEEVVAQLVEACVITQAVGDILLKSDRYNDVLTTESLEVSELLANLVRLMNKRIKRVIENDEYVYLLEPIG